MYLTEAWQYSSAHPSYQHVASLLENGVAALLYSGARDFICNAKVGGKLAGMNLFQT